MTPIQENKFSKSIIGYNHCVFCALYVMRQMNRELHAQGLVRQVALSMGGYSQQLFFDLLEQFESSVYDEYGIEGEDEGSLVPPLACEFSKEKSFSHILGLVDENGYVVIYDTNRCGPNAIIKDWRAHNNAIFDLSWIEGENKLLTAAGDQSIGLWDVLTAKKINTFQGHTSSVRSVSVKKDDPAVFATGSRDGHIMVWDTRCSRKGKGLFTSPVQIIKNAHSVPQMLKTKRKSKLGPSRDSQQSVTIVVYQTDMTLLSAGAVDGCVKMWDLRKNYTVNTNDPVSKHTFHYSGTNKRSHGYSSLVLDSYSTKLYASCTDDIIYQYDLVSHNQKPEACFKGHQNKSFYVKAAISPDNQFLLSGSSNDLAYIWKIDKPNESPIVLKGHNAEVTDVSWSRNDFTKLTTLSDDNTMRIWRINRRQSVREPREVTGYAERTHREIGISASRQVEDTPNKVPSTPKTVSPSILHFLSKSAQKNAICDRPSSEQEIKKCKEDSSETNETPSILQSAMYLTGRVSCKRKLVCDEIDDNPLKRQNTGDVDIALTSPIKPSTSNATIRSPWKCDENPEKWLLPCTSKSPIGSPHKKCVLNEVPSTINSPRKSESVPTSVPSHVKTKLFSPPLTVNLPNLVLEGTIRDRNVNLKNCDKENSPKCRKIDWLTQKRLEKEYEIACTIKDFSSPKAVKSLNDQTDGGRQKKEYNSPKVNKKTKLKDISSDFSSSQETDSQDTDSTPKKAIETPPRGMRSLKHYFTVK